MPKPEVVELFAGPGGTSQGFVDAGFTGRAVGIELDADACKTAVAAGHERLQDDISQLDPMSFEGVVGVLGSPPCQGFSTAGKGLGVEDSKLLIQTIVRCTSADDVERAIEYLHDHMKDDRSVLVLEPLLWALALRPEWVALEQVPQVLPIWRAIGMVLNSAGYATNTAVLHAEQYGVPQTRRRAILVASRVRIPRLPWPTHSKFHTRTPDQIDEPYLPWVSMAEALEWPKSLVGFPRKDDGRAGGIVTLDGVDYRGRDFRDTDQPSLAVTEKTRSWKRFERLPKVMAAAGTSCTTMDPRLVGEPAATITGMGTAEWGQRVARAAGPKSRDPEGVRVEPWEAGVIQSFPADYPWQGTRTSQFKQVGNAVPPRLAAAYLKQFVEPQEMSNAG